jgi:hypothetical protein
MSLHPGLVEFSLRETAKPIQQGESVQRTSMYASFLKICPPLEDLSASGGFIRLWRIRAPCPAWGRENFLLCRRPWRLSTKSSKMGGFGG